MTLESLEKEVQKYINENNLSSALDLIVDFVQRVVNDPLTIGVLFGSSRLDKLCLEIGNKFSSGTLTSDEGPTVILTTEMGKYGGHTLLIEDLMKAQKDQNYVILMTDLLNRADISGLVERFKSSADLRSAPIGNPLDKLIWLTQQLEDLKPSKVFLFNYNQDAVAVSALVPLLDSGRVFFCHHADHHLCLGVHLPGATHIDFHNMGLHNCRVHERLVNNKFLPLVCEDRGRRANETPFLMNGKLTTCSSGMLGKFNLPYEFSYVDMISKRLKVVDGTHFHIGNLSDQFLAVIHQKLAENGVDAKRFVHIPWVGSLWLELVKLEIDLYINSFPIGGGRACIEAMGAGIPLLMHECDISRYHGGVDSAYPEAFVWKNEKDFCECLQSIDSTTLAGHSLSSRHFYETNHLPSLLEAELEKMYLNRNAFHPPKLRDYHPDYLNRYCQNQIQKIEYINQNYENLIAQKNIVIKELQEDIGEILSSKSWRWTARFRWLSDKISRFVGRH